MAMMSSRLCPRPRASVQPAITRRAGGQETTGHKADGRAENGPNDEDGCHIENPRNLSSFYADDEALDNHQ
jgi:hypothetical protein